MASFTAPILSYVGSIDNESGSYGSVLYNIYVDIFINKLYTSKH